MDWWLLGIILVLAYLGIQNFGHHVRWKAAVKGFSALSEMMGTLAEIPKAELDKGMNMWTEARITAERNTAVGAIMLLIIVIFLVVLGIHGKI